MSAILGIKQDKGRKVPLEHPNGYLELLAHLGIGGAHPGGLALTKSILQHLSISTKTRIIDIGCGTGQTAAFIQKTYPCQVTALDQNKLMVEKARERFKKENLDIELIEGDAECLPLKKEDYDVVIAESVTIFTNLRKSIHEYARVLKPGGILVDIELAAATPLTEDEKEFCDFYQVRNVPTEKEWRQSFLEAGFRSIKVIRKGSVSGALNSTVQHLDELPDFNPSPLLDSTHFHLSLRHSMLMDQYSTRLKYCVFQMKKG